MTDQSIALAEVIDGQSATRRVPVQRRSRERVERILAVATDLIAADGSDALRMNNLAERADVSIGSLYQYFPDKSAVIRALAERFNAQGQACVAAEFAEIRNEQDLRLALIRSVDGYYAMFLGEPVMRDIWSGTQADKALQDMAVADVRAHAEMLRGALTQVNAEADPGELATTSLLTMQLMDSAVRLAISVGREEGDALIAAFKRTVLGDCLFD